MNDASWERLVDSIEVKLGIDRHGKDSRALEDRPDLTERVDFVEFSQGGRELRLERITGPAIIDRKSHYSHRPGVANRMETIYDPSETAHRIKLYVRSGGEWSEADPSALGL